MPLDAEASRRLLARRVGDFAGTFFAVSLAFYLPNAVAIAVMHRARPPLTRIETAKATRAGGSTPGPRTVAADLERRSPSSRGRASGS